MRGVKHHGRARLAHDRQAAHIAHQVVVAKAGATLAGHETVFVQAFFARCGTGLVDDILHVTRGQELAFLDIDRLARLRHGVDEVGLAAQKGRRLQHIDHRRHSGDVGFRVHIGEHRHTEIALDLGQDLEPLDHAGAAKAGAAGAVGLVVA